LASGLQNLENLSWNTVVLNHACIPQRNDTVALLSPHVAIRRFSILLTFSFFFQARWAAQSITACNASLPEHRLQYIFRYVNVVVSHFL